MMKVRNLGKRSLDEVKRRLEELGLHFSEEDMVESVEDFPVIDGELPVMGGLREAPSSRNEFLVLTIEELDFSVRTYNCLKRAGVLTVADMISMSMDDYMRVRNMGRKSLEEIENKLSSMGLSMRDAEDDLF